MKKILLSLLSFGIFGVSLSSVVSCSTITFQSLMARTQPTDLLKLDFKSAINNWASPTASQLDDSKVLTNLVDTLLAGDKYDNFEGDLVDKWGHNKNSDEFYFHMRDEKSDPGNVPTWVDINQKIQAKVEAHDLFNTFRYIFNPNNMSENLFAWQTLVKNGQNLANALSILTTQPNSNSEKNNEGLQYDSKFDRWAYDSDGGLGAKTAQEAKSNLYIDRFILAYNLKLNLNEAYQIAINPNDSASLNSSRQLNMQGQRYNYNQLINASMADGQILKIGDFNSEQVSDVINTKTTYNIHIYLNKPAPYFEGAASFLAWAPMPDIAVDYLSTKQSGYNYGSKGPENIWYSGPYVVETYQPQQTIKLVANENYFAKDAIKIKTLLHSNVHAGDVSTNRMLFESGDLSFVLLNPTDSSGWNKYVGRDYDFSNPDSITNFEGTQVIDIKNGATSLLYFNFHNNTKDSKGKLTMASDNANKALALNSVRQFLAYHLNRSYIASYYSSTIDGGSKTSKLLRNIFTSKNTATWEDEASKIKYDYNAYVNDLYSGEFKDYTDNADTTISPMKLSGIPESKDNGYLEDLKEVLRTSKIPLPTLEQMKKWDKKFGKLNDGIDAYLQNDMIGLQTFLLMDQDGTQYVNLDDQQAAKQFVPLIGKYDKESDYQKMKLIVEKVKKDLSRQIGSQSIALPWLMDGSASTTINLKINDTIGKFEALNIDYPGLNSPITFDKQITIDKNGFTKNRSAGNFSIAMGGWTPDFADASSYLNALIYDGAFSKNEGWTDLFDKNNNVITLKSTFDKNKYADLLNRFSYFDQLATSADQVGDAKTRNANFAKAEMSGIMTSQLLMPMFANALDKIPTLSYINSFSRSTQPFGQVQYKFLGVELNSHLLTNEEFKQKQQKFAKERNDYRAIYPRGHNGYDYKNRKTLI